jgi:drug/metabolite transporter (DMT)-like permease
MATLTHAAAPVLLGLAAALTWGAADFTGGIAARRGSPGRVVFFAHGASLLLLALLVLLTHPLPLSHFNWLWALVSGVSGGVALMLFYEALATGAMGLNAALAGVLTAALPVAVAIAREGRPGGWQMAGFTVAAVAIGLIASSPELPPNPDLEPGSKPAASTSLRSLALSAFAGLGFGVQLVVLHLASAQGSVLRALTLSRAGGTVAGVAAMLLSTWRAWQARSSSIEAQEAGLPTGKADRIESPSTAIRRAMVAFVALAALAGLLDTLGNGLYMASALVGRLDVAAVLASLYPGATILLAVWLLNERTTRWQTAGMVLALIAVALISA